MAVNKMGFYAHHGVSAGQVGQEELAEKRRISEVLKQIADCQAMVMGTCLFGFGAVMARQRRRRKRLIGW